MSTEIISRRRPRSSLFSSTIQVTRLVWEQRVLLYQLTKREIDDPYAGQMFGRLWAYIHPLFLMAVYLFVFGVVFKTKLGGTYEMPRDYTTYILSGLVPWLTFQTNLAKSCNAILGNASLVKQVVFPIEILPVKTVLATLLSQLLFVLIICIHVIFKYKSLPTTYLLLPYLIVVQTIFSIGLAYFLSAVGVFIKDLKDVVTLFTVASIYLLPVVYLPQWVPAIFKPFLYINPFSYLIWCFQDALYYGRFMHPWAWILLPLFALSAYVIGISIFRNFKHVFGDAL